MNFFKKSVLLLAICSAMYGCSSEEEQEENVVTCESIGDEVFCDVDEVMDIGDWAKEEESLLPSELPKSEIAKNKNNKENTVNNDITNNVVKDESVKQESVKQESVEEEVFREMVATVKSGDTFLTILARENIPSQFFYNLSKKKQDYLVNINVGDKINFVVNEKDNSVIKIQRQVSKIASVTLRLNDGKYDLEYEKGDVKRVLLPYFVNIKRSLYLDGIAEGISQNIIANLQNTLSEQFSFNRDLRKGDRISLMIEEFHHEGERIGKQSLVGVVIDSQKRGEIAAIKHESSNGSVGFYNEKGESLVTGFMRHPISSYKRISSRFNPKRRHPISGRVRPHNGTDYAAPTGTPIYAASDGIVRTARYNGGYGNVVYIDHSKGVQTRYAHMHGISVKRGQRVSKGQIIGTVGTTGASTGPHLHYEYWVNSRAKDSLKIDLPLSEGLSGQELAEFNRFKSNVLAALSSSDSNMLASLSK
jgi:murein DD-endopeptidase MepM/ murein hydrolase activator NlpD